MILLIEIQRQVIIQTTIPNETIMHHLAFLVESFVRDYTAENHRELIKWLYPGQSEYSSLSMYTTEPKPGHHNRGDASYNGKYGILYGWNGDLVIVFHDSEHGKRAVVFEIKRGRHIQLSDSQKRFFKELKSAKINGNLGDFLHKLQDVKVVIVHCTNFEIKNWNRSNLPIRIKFIQNQWCNIFNSGDNNEETSM